jgi:hypothetical protein
MGQESRMCFKTCLELCEVFRNAFSHKMRPHYTNAPEIGKLFHSWLFRAYIRRVFSSSTVSQKIGGASLYGPYEYIWWWSSGVLIANSNGICENNLELYIRYYILNLFLNTIVLFHFLYNPQLKFDPKKYNFLTFSLEKSGIALYSGLNSIRNYFITSCRK